VILHGLHRLVKREALRKIPECLGVTILTDWRSRTMYSISLWRDMKDIYKMGEVQKHILAARVPGRLGVHTESGVFTYVGDWRRVLFSSKYSGSSPITGWEQEPVQGGK
jgi:hypothetical protein